MSFVWLNGKAAFGRKRSGLLLLISIVPQSTRPQLYGTRNYPKLSKSINDSRSVLFGRSTSELNLDDNGSFACARWYLRNPVKGIENSLEWNRDCMPLAVHQVAILPDSFRSDIG